MLKVNQIYSESKWQRGKGIQPIPTRYLATAENAMVHPEVSKLNGGTVRNFERKIPCLLQGFANADSFFRILSFRLTQETTADYCLVVIGKGMANPQGLGVRVARVRVRVGIWLPLKNPYP
jgi:hypothetical protein